MAKAKRQREIAVFDVVKEFPELARKYAREKELAPPGFDQPPLKHYEWIKATALALADGFFPTCAAARVDNVTREGQEQCEVMSFRAQELRRQVEIFLPKVYSTLFYVGRGLNFGMPGKNHNAAISEWRWIAEAAETAAAAAATVHDDALLSPAQLAKTFGIPEMKAALKKRLERLRKTDLNCFTEVAGRGSKDPQFLFRVRAARPIIEALKASRETSRKRPAKKFRA